MLVCARRLEAVGDILGALASHVPVYLADQPVMDGIVGFHIHRGLLALAERGPGHSASELLDGLGPAATVVGVIGVSNHDNVGGIFRNAAAFGASAVLLDATSCDPLYRKAIRVSVGGALLVPFARCPSPATILAALAARGFEAIALTPRGEERIEAIAPGPRRALLLGAEGPGLPDEVLARARRARIEIVAGFDSLNVAVASGIALHALAARPA